MTPRRTALALVAAGLAFAPARADEKENAKPKVEVVFCLDTTGSMGGLIEGAKQKIWAIVNQIASGKPGPDVKIGLVAFRDVGDDYVTKVFDLTDDLDKMHANLQGFKADGGGDTPESVNQALNESVAKVAWSKDKDVLKMVFLVGDAPPHMDYKTDVKYPETCKLAVEKGILINAVQCGADKECQKAWLDIAAQGGGSYVQIAADGGVKAVETPFDKELSEINVKLTRTNVCYGVDAARKEGDAKKEAGTALAPGAGGADRGAFLGKAARVAANDLIDDLKEKKVKLDEVKEAELPDEMKKMTPAERKAHVEKLQKEREELKAKSLDLDAKRAAFVKKKLEEKGDKAKDGFDNQVLETLRKQAKKFKIDY